MHCYHHNPKTHTCVSIASSTAPLTHRSRAAKQQPATGGPLARRSGRTQECASEGGAAGAWELRRALCAAPAEGGWRRGATAAAAVGGVCGGCHLTSRPAVGRVAHGSAGPCRKGNDTARDVRGALCCCCRQPSSLLVNSLYAAQLRFRFNGLFICLHS